MADKNKTARSSLTEPGLAEEAGQTLGASIANLDEDTALELADRLITQGLGKEVLNQALQGLKVVGQRYEAGEYFVAGLVMAGEIMRQILQLVSERSPLSMSGDGPAGVIVLGTVEGDIHDLGKDLAKEVLASNGFEVHDLGVDVAPEIFLAETIRRQPDFVGLSILISSCYPALTKTVTELRNLIPAGFKRPGIMIGGGAVDELLFEHTKADIWCRDLMAMADVCRNWIAKRDGELKAEPRIM